MDRRLAVNEVFGPTVQGEGVNVGMPCMFLRLAGCNLACSWCDSRHAWDWASHDKSAEVSMMSTGDVAAALGSGPKALVVTGGEPMLQQDALVPLLGGLREAGWWVEVETAGTVGLSGPWLADLYTVSPKLANSGNATAARLVPSALRSYTATGRAVFKFVVNDIDDLAEARNIAAGYDPLRVYAMPQGVDRETLGERSAILVDEIISMGWWVSPRLHVEIWGGKRGR